MNRDEKRQISEESLSVSYYDIFPIVFLNENFLEVRIVFLTSKKGLNIKFKPKNLNSIL